MDRYCPECNSKMDPSIVGHLCINCGHVQRFYSNSGLALEESILPDISDSEIDSPNHNEVRPKAKEAEVSSPKLSIKERMKRLVIPEISPPHYKQITAKPETKKLSD